MSYYVSQTNSKFYMKKEHNEEALKALKNTFPNMPTLQKINNLEDALCLLGFVINGKKDAWDEIEFCDNFYHGFNEKKCLNAIAPFVKEGSFMELHGEDSNMWRLVFTQNSVKEFRPKIIWDMPQLQKDNINITKEDKEKPILTKEEADCFNYYLEDAGMDIAFGNSDWNEIYSKIVGSNVSDYARKKQDYYYDSFER